jgi:molecular chaperone IbpA
MCAGLAEDAPHEPAWLLKAGHPHVASEGGLVMRQFDFSPLYRSTIGFDRLAQLLDSVAGFDDEVTSYPPYNIERLADNQYRITMAVAGFGEDEINIEAKETTLSVHGEKKPDQKERHFLHRGIAQRSFERRFQLADYVEVTGAELKDGLLHIDLVRNLPERMRPRRIEIASTPQPERVEARA